MTDDTIGGTKPGTEPTKPANPSNYMVLDVEVLPEEVKQKQVSEYLMDKNFPWKMHPMFSRVLVVGLKFPNKDTELYYFKDEKELLEKFWSRLKDLKPGLIVTFNGYNFDIPFIHVRSKLNNVSSTMDINLNKWRSDNSNHFDCMQVLSANQAFLNVALDISCQVLDISIPEPRHYGDEVYKLYQAGDMASIKEHCRQDVELTEQLFLKIK
jgi:DNA polymerase elongation subunit (family B)